MYRKISPCRGDDTVKPSATRNSAVRLIDGRLADYSFRAAMDLLPPGPPSPIVRVISAITPNGGADHDRARRYLRLAKKEGYWQNGRTNQGYVAGDAISKPLTQQQERLEFRTRDSVKFF